MEQAPDGWSFTVEEFAYGGWRCVGERVTGQTVSRDNSDADAARRDCWAAARWVDGELERVTFSDAD